MNKKECIECDKSLPIGDFYYGRNQCVKCYQHKRKIWERSAEGHVKRVYHSMAHRVSGGCLHANVKYNGRSKGAHYYVGLPIVSKDEFILWSLGDADYKRLHEEWEEADYDRRSTPSIDRIDSRYGYIFGNMEWVTLSENCKNVNKFRKL